jgi:hypothetical protein
MPFFEMSVDRKDMTSSAAWMLDKKGAWQQKND